MPGYKKKIVWVVLIMMVFTFFLLPIPTSCAPVSNQFNQTISPDSLETGFFDVFMNLLGKILNKVFHINIGLEGNSTLPNSEKAGKDVLGFYAEWWDGDSSSYTSMVNNIGILNTIITFWATVQPDGNISSRGGKDHTKVINFAHENKVSAFLMVNNAKQGSDDNGIQAVLASVSLRKKVIDALEDYLKSNHLDGVNIDFEMLPYDSKDNLTTFIRELSERLKPQGYTVSIDVFPKSDESNDVSMAYDYAGLAKYADMIIIMAYDNHGSWSSPGPVAAIDWVEDNLKYALRFIPRHKLYLGVAGYGYDWSSKGVESLEYNQVIDLTQRFSADIEWDEVSKSPKFSYSDSDMISHSVWFENSYSIKYKLDLSNKYDLAGIALWKLGEEDPGDWALFKDKLKSK